MIFKTIDKTMDKSHTKAGLFLLNQAFRFGIPFNISHAFNISKLDKGQSVVSIPKIKTNTNHLGTIHACAMATAGEFGSGILILKNFGAANVRLVLKSMNIDYQRQGTSKITATATLSDNETQDIRAKLDIDDKVFVDMKAELRDSKGEVVSTVRTTWQVKKWSAVSTKF